MGKTVFVNRYYYPDHSATAQILTDLAEYLAVNDSLGQTTIVTSRLDYSDPNVTYPSRSIEKGVKIHRVWTSSFGRKNLLGRLMDYLSFYISAFFYLLFIVKRNDTVVAKTDPPLISVVVMLVCILKRARLVNWLQDLFPEVAKGLGIKGLNSVTYSCVKWIRNCSLNFASANVVLGGVMNDKIGTEIKKPKTKIIPNWSIAQELKPIDRADNVLIAEWGLENKFVIGYSGNLGRAHDYPIFYQVACALQYYTDIVFLFIGNGYGMDQLKAMVEIDDPGNIVFKPYQPLEILNESLSVPDVHLITLEPQMEGLIVPSKYYGVLGVGKPIIYIGSKSGELGRDILTNSLGVVVEPKDFEAFQQAVVRFYQSRDSSTNLLGSLQENVRAVYERHYAPDQSRLKWRQLLDSLSVRT